MAAAARMAKNGHTVTVLEARPRAGGHLVAEAADGSPLETGAADMLLPAAVRDLFRKSGRPLERELGLQMLEESRDHHDLRRGVVVTVPLTGRGAQQESIAAALGTRAARHWTAALDRIGDLWVDHHLQWENDPSPTRDTFRLTPGERLGPARRLLQPFTDPTPPSRAGIPGITAAGPYLERTLGRWRPDGGAAALVAALAARLDLRGVEVRCGTPAHGLVAARGEVRGVRTADDEVRADVTVLAVGVPDLRALLENKARPRGDVVPGLDRWRADLSRVRPAPAPAVTLVRVAPEHAPTAYETLFHRHRTLVRRIGVRDDASVDLVVERHRPHTPLPLPVLGSADLTGGPFARGPEQRSLDAIGRLPHVYGEVPGLMVVGSSTHLAGMLATELLSAAIAADAVGPQRLRAGRSSGPAGG